MEEGKTFWRNEFGTSVVNDFRYDHNKQTIHVLSQNHEETAMKKIALAEVTYEEGLFIHVAAGRYFELEGARKSLCLALGEKWTGGDTIDDFC